ncbi:hypothetical protein [Gorillibacterium sp. sgz500922]|uniref:hypothetical protein n=1 Tax=Gorillibacterium sp. sgz500922 TaxID=3446694 RepID=UPI003F6729A1
MSYSIEKRDIISNIETEKLTNFIKSISTPLLSILLKRLPKVNGFRPEKEVEVKISKYSKRIMHWTEKDWELMKEIWLAWTQSNESFRNVLNFTSKLELVSELESHYENNDLKELVKKLIQQRGNEVLSRDALRDWLKFSPFLPDSKIEELLEQAPSQDEITNKLKLNSFEQRLKQNETQIKSIDQQNKVINDNTAKQVLKLIKEYVELKEEFNKLDIRINEYTYDKDTYERELSRLKNNIDNKLKEYKNLVNELNKNTVKINNQLTNQISEVEKNSQEQIDSFSLKVNEISEQLERQRKVHTEVLDQLFQMKTDLENTISSVFNTAVTTQQISKGMNDLRVDLFPQKDISEPIILSGVEEALSHLEENLKRTGIILAHARKLSLELISALISGQMVSFSGSLAVTVAEVVAKTLVGDSIYKIKIPLGIMSPIPFELAFERLIFEKMIGPKVILIEGINRSTFEVYGGTLHKFISERVLRINTNIQIIILATITEGLGALPLSKGVIEMGPIYNTEALGWGDKPAINPILSIINPSDIYDEIMQNPYSILLDEEDLGLPIWARNVAGVLWRKAILSVERISSLLCERMQYKTVGLITTFGWLIPMLYVCKRSKLLELQSEVELDDRSKLFIEIIELQEEII